MFKKLTFYISLFLLIAFLYPGQTQAPKRFLLRYTDAFLAYSPQQGSPQIGAQGNVLSYCQDWEVKQLQPFLYHMKQEFWKDFYWKVNTSRKEVYQVTNGIFGALGGKDILLDIMVEVVESTSPSPPVSETASDSRVYGRVIDATTGRGIPGLTIQAMDKDMVFDDILGAAITDSRGNFEIRYTYTMEEAADTKPDIYLKILDANGQQIHKTDTRSQASLEEQFVVRITRR